MPTRVFISYRRSDTPHAAARIFDYLTSHFESGVVFMDVDSLPGGVDFVAELGKQIEMASVMLLVIGKTWLTCIDPETGRPRLKNPNDFVRIEIEHALRLNIEIIPVLVDEARMPQSTDLDTAIVAIARRQAMRLTQERFRADLAGLKTNIVVAIERYVERRIMEERLRKADEERRKVEEERIAAEESELRRQKLLNEAMHGLSSTQLATAEALANWEIVKESGNVALLRDHLARYPSHEQSVNWVQTKLDEITWISIRIEPSRRDLENYLEQFPNGKWADNARKIIAAAERNTTGIDKAVIETAIAFPIEEVIQRYSEEYKVGETEAINHAIEAKRYLALCAMNPHKSYGMCGPIDKFWHTFIIFTELYTAFCRAISGRYLHHKPFTEPTDGTSYTVSSTRLKRTNESNLNSKVLLERAYNEMLNDYQTVYGFAPREDYWPRFVSRSERYVQEGCYGITMRDNCGS